MLDDREDEMKKMPDERVNARENGVGNEERGKEEKSDQQKSITDGGETNEEGEGWNKSMRKNDIGEKDQNISENCGFVDNGEKTRIDQDQVQEKTFTLASNSGLSSSNTSKRPKVIP